MGSANFPGHTSATATIAGGITTINATTTAPTTIIYPITFPKVEFTVSFHRAIPETWHRVYDAAKLREQITAKFHLRPDALPDYTLDPIVAASTVNN
jgi:hypothetical protein